MAKKHSPQFLKICEAAKSKIQEITNEHLKSRMGTPDAPVLIDVREDHEWAKGHIPGAVHLGRGILERDIEALYPDFSSTIVLYCGGGFRSALAADSIQKMGYTNVKSLAGGYSGWTDKGFAISTEVSNER